MSDWKRNLDALLQNAEHTSRYPFQQQPPTNYHHQQQQQQQQQQYHDAAGLLQYRQSNNNNNNFNSNENSNGSAREIRVCMRELSELRAELQAEKECRGALMTSLTKRLKDELTIEMSAVKLSAQREVKEAEIKWRRALDEFEQNRKLESHKGEEYSKAIKAQERYFNENMEEIKDELHDLDNKVVSALASVQQLRLDNSRSLEQEKHSMQHRLDLEMQRYAELHRQQVNMINDMKQTVAKEVAVVGKTVQDLVQQVWEERWGSVSRAMTERLEEFKQCHELSMTMVNEFGTKITTNHAEYKAEVGMMGRELRDRVTQLECTLPATAARVERTEKRVEVNGETLHQVANTMDTVRAMCEHASGVASSLSERMGRLEESTFSRDTKVADLETRCESLQHVDKIRANVEVVKRTVERLETQNSNMKDTTDQCERATLRLTDDMEDFATKFSSIEKRMNGAITRVEISDQRTSSHATSLCKLQATLESQAQQVTQADHTITSMKQTLAVVETRTEMLQTRLDSAVTDLSQRVSKHEVHLDRALEVAAKSEQQVAAATKAVDRFERKAERMEATLENSTENVSAMRETVDATAKDTKELRRLLEQHRDSVASMGATTDRRCLELDEKVAGLSDHRRAIEETIERIGAEVKRNQNVAERSHRSLRNDLEQLSTTVSAWIAEGSEKQHVPQPLIAQRVQYVTIPQQQEQQPQPVSQPAVTQAANTVDVTKHQQTNQTSQPATTLNQVEQHQGKLRDDIDIANSNHEQQQTIKTMEHTSKSQEPTQPSTNTSKMEAERQEALEERETTTNTSSAPPATTAPTAAAMTTSTTLAFDESSDDGEGPIIQSTSQRADVNDDKQNSARTTSSVQEAIRQNKNNNDFDFDDDDENDKAEMYVPPRAPEASGVVPSSPVQNVVRNIATEEDDEFDFEQQARPDDTEKAADAANTATPAVAQEQHNEFDFDDEDDGGDAPAVESQPTSQHSGKVGTESSLSTIPKVDEKDATVISTTAGQGNEEPRVHDDFDFDTSPSPQRNLEPQKANNIVEESFVLQDMTATTTGSTQEMVDHEQQQQQQQQLSSKPQTSNDFDDSTTT
eukprot:PhM_4_TR16816/c5_g1_i1/m.104593